MKTSIKGKVSVLDREAEKQVVEDGEWLCSRLGERIATLNLGSHRISQAGSTTCDAVPRTASRFPIAARHLDPHARRAAFAALERARVQVRPVVPRSPKISSRSLGFAASLGLSGR